MSHKIEPDTEGRLPITLFWYDDGKNKWEAEDCETIHDAAEYAACELGDCNMRMIIWNWKTMKPHSAHEAWIFT